MDVQAEGAVNDPGYRFVGNVVKCHMVFEGKIVVDDVYLVVDEYTRPGENGFGKTLYCLLLNIGTGVTHEVAAYRLVYGPYYQRIA